MRNRMDTMRRAVPLTIIALSAAAVLAACSSAPPRRVFPPQAKVQQLQVLADGSWSVQLRLQNFSNVSMRFDRLHSPLRIDGLDAGTLTTAPALAAGPESADVIDVAFAPSATARAAVGAAIAARGTVRYALDGVITACDLHDGATGKCRDYDFSYDSVLSPVPGLDGVLR